MTSSLQIQGSCIDNNHSHFLLVDDGTEGKYGGEIAFRARLQNCLSNKEISKSKYLRGSVFFFLIVFNVIDVRGITAPKHLHLNKFLVRKGSSFCERGRLNFQAFA